MAAWGIFILGLSIGDKLLQGDGEVKMTGGKLPTGFGFVTYDGTTTYLIYVIYVLTYTLIYSLRPFS